MPYEKDDIGLPTDPQIRELFDQICDIAGRLGEGVPPDRADTLVRQYENTLQELYSLGWNDYIDIDCSIAPMPEMYHRKIKELESKD